MNFLDELYKRRKKLADVLSDEEYSGIRKIVEDLYPDRAHFIYELLQNAEDADATEAIFILEQDKLVFEHNGRPFSEADVERITNIGKGKQDEDKIGRFGVGFKSVFAYSETPHIYSPTYSFRITDMVLPSEIPINDSLARNTRFEFPFNSIKKDPTKAYQEIEAGLSGLAGTTLLFLASLRRIRWTILGQEDWELRRQEHSDHLVEITIGKHGVVKSRRAFLRFSQPVIGLKKQSVSIAFECFLSNDADLESKKPLNEMLEIVGATPGRVCVFFPAEKETSGLRFHLNAPFVPELSRASVKDTPANLPLFEQLARLAAECLHKIRDAKLLTPNFLSVLPNSQDTIPNRYIPIRDAIIREMKNKPLTPTHTKSYAPAKDLLQSKASIKNLITQADLQFLIRENDQIPLQWAVGVSQKNSLQDRFLSDLEIPEWGMEAFVKFLQEKASKGIRWSENYSRWVEGPNQRFMTWLSKKSEEWHEQMYVVIREETLTGLGYKKREIMEKVKPLQIVRLSDGKYGVGSETFFPSLEVENDEIFQRVARGVYSSGKSLAQNHSAKQFLIDIGVREVGKTEEVEAILKTRYTGKGQLPDEKMHLRDLNEFINLVEKEPAKAALFSEYYIFSNDKMKWARPRDIYLDLPYLDTGLTCYYEAIPTDERLGPLSASYQNSEIGLTRLTDFAKTVGAQTVLKPVEITCDKNPEWSYLRNVPGQRYSSPRDVDYLIPQIQQVLEKPKKERLIAD